jgi:hypothetical protein
MNDVGARLRLLFPPDTHVDWDDVVRRAGSSRRLPRLVFGIAVLVAAVLAVGSALALTGRLGNLLHGEPVRDLTPRERFVLSELNVSGKVELIAKKGSRTFYVIRRHGGQRCYALGESRKGLTPAQAELNTRFSAVSCIDPRVFPSKAVPVLDFSSFFLRRGDKEASLYGLRGFAADPIAKIGVIGHGNQIVLTTDVEGNVYSIGRKSIPGARGIVALDHHGKVIWVQCTAVAMAPSDPRIPHGGCGRYKNSPPPNFRSPRHPALGPPRRTGPVVVQRGSAAGVSIVVRGADVEADFSRAPARTRALLQSKDGRITPGCFKLVKVGKRIYAKGVGVTHAFSTTTRVRLFGLAAPYDGCTVAATYGHTWNDAHGTHDLVEIPLTAKGRRYFVERAVARDIAWLARSRVFKAVRYAQQPFTSASAAEYLAQRVDPLADPTDTPPVGRVGIWLGPDRRIVLVERAPTGRRLFLELRRGVIFETNLIGFTGL